MLDFPRWKIALVLLACVLSCLFALPNVLPAKLLENMPEWLPRKAMNLGLDLQGGSYLLLEVDVNTFMAEKLEDLQDEIRARLNEAKLGYKNMAVRDGKVYFDLPEGMSADDVKSKLREASRDFVIEDVEAGISVHYSDTYLTDLRSKLIEQSIMVVDRRVNETGTREPIIQRQGDNRVLLQVPGLQNPDHLKNLLGQTAKMTFHMVNTTVSQADIQAGNVPAGTRIYPGDEKAEPGAAPQKYAVFGRALLTGDMLTGAAATYNLNEPVVSFTFDSQGSRKFADITRENVGKPFAILLDGKVITAPVINSPILGGSGIIEGNFTIQTANDLALLLRAGALPAPLKVVEERSVGPSLGEDSIAAGKNASILAVGLIALFMILFYGLFGGFANIALILNFVINIAVLSLFQATLTLPGIAGLVLTLGMAVDANVLIYERIREEIRNGKSPFASVDSGFKVALATIIDSHITTLIASILLYAFGSGTIRGFAVTMIIGIITSLFTATMCTRLMVVLWLKMRRPKTIPI